MSAACRGRRRWSICWSRRTRASHTTTPNSIAQVAKAVAEIVAHQVAIGIDVVSDGEASKIGYATYIKDRLTGFGGEPFVPKPQRDLADYPDFRNRMIQFTGPQVFRRLCCIGDIEAQRP